MTPMTDPEILSGFYEEVHGYFPAMRAGLADFAATPAEPQTLVIAHRHTHTIKGAAAMVGFSEMSQLAGKLEARLEECLEGRRQPTDDAISLFDLTMTALETHLEFACGKSETAPAAEEFTELIQALAELPGEVLPPRERSDSDDETDIGRDFFEMNSNDTRIDLATLTAPSFPAHDDETFADDFPLPSFAALRAPGELSRAPEPTVPPVAFAADGPELDAIPTELLEVFRLEADEHLRTLTTLLPAARLSPANKDQWQEIRRAAHTLKGAAGMVGFRNVTTLAHRMEDLLDSYFEGTRVATVAEIDTLLRATDAIEDTIAGRPADFTTLLASLDQFQSSTDTAVSVVQSPTAIASDDSEKNEIATPRREANEAFVRVPIDRLNEIVKLMGELVISRTAIESRMGDFNRLLNELSPSTARLRRASVRLETGYEARALAGSSTVARETVPGQSDGGFEQLFGRGGDGFDDLEFDRYTELHLISRELAETTNDMQTLGGELGYVHGDFDGYLTRQARLASEIEDKLMRLRMVPLSTIGSKLKRTVRNAAELCGKLAELHLDGERTGLDKTVLEAMGDPLLHLLRNAVDHGLETPEVRRALGKPECGSLHFQAYHEGSQVVLVLSDDGRGIDADAVRAIAVSRGLVSADAAESLPDSEVFQFVFLPGFSTKDTVSELSGRGVGLDVVKTNVEALKGTVTITSQLGRGTSFIVRLPMTLAVTRALMVRANQQTFAIPLDAIQQILRLEDGAEQTIGAESVLKVGANVYPVRHLGRVLNLHDAPDENLGRPPVLLLKVGEKTVALVVEKLLGGREIVIKSLGTHLKRVRGISGATLLGDGSVVLILNPAELLSVSNRLARYTPTTPTVARSRTEQVAFVVDDSPSVRRVLTNLLERNGYKVQTAKDGLEALELLGKSTILPQVVLSDIEMPRMDGYELLGSLRGMPNCATLPVVMITSRAADKHRRKAMELGASAYVVKPYQDESLLEILRQLSRLAKN